MSKTLLLIEDSFTTQEVVQMAFAHDDIVVITTTTLAEALREMQHVTPDVIVADASLPEVNGFQLCQMMRDMAGRRDLPVVLLTSGFAAYDEAQGERIGVTGHLAKPFEAHALRQLVQRVIEAPAPLATPLPQDTLQTPTATPRSAATSDRIAGAGAQEGVARQAPLPLSERQDVTALDALMAQWTSGSASLPASTDVTAAEALGRLMLQVLRDTLQTHLEHMLERLTPQILAAVQDIVAKKAPELLEALLQREIDKLKQAIDADDRDGE
jgi:CheY-like chemotaxis protein